MKSIPSYNQDKGAVEKKDQLLTRLTHLPLFYVQERWNEKELSATLFMGIKGAFDHVSRGQLSTRMIKF